MSTDSKEIRYYSEPMALELTQALVEKLLVTRGQVEELNARRALTGEPVANLLVDDGLVSEADVLSILSELSGIPFQHIADLHIDPQAVTKIQARAALRYRVMPVNVSGATVTLAVNQVPTLATADSLRMLLNTAVDWVLCTEQDISKTIKHFYGLGAETLDHLLLATPRNDIEMVSTDVADESADAGMIKFVNQIIAEAIRMGATDIHIEPFEDTLRLRYRIDGILQVIPLPQGVLALRKAVSSCVKIMADMNIAEHRMPHDGRIRVRSGNDEFDLRVSLLPSAFGETVNMRILNRKTMFLDLKHLGLTDSQRPPIEYLTSMPHGVVLLTGPTGSGKTTTLYALLSRLNTNEVKIITVEDPVEYQIKGINQIQVNTRIGLTFAAMLRSILRHDPDIVLIGEIRDMETADIAVRASLTGHLVFSTLHTNDAPSAITRLNDMGVEPYLISSCLEGVIAQRLVRVICNECREETTLDDTIRAEMTLLWPERMEGAKFYRGRGCPACNFTGYRGRIALFEIMLLNDELRSLIVHQRPSNEIKRAAMANGLVTLRRDGWSRVLEGVTTADEVMRVARKVDTEVSSLPS